MSQRNNAHSVDLYSTTAMTSSILERQTPVMPEISDFDDLDAFDAREDSFENLPYVFSPDAIREELAKNMPEIHETTWDDKTNAPFSEGAPFNSSEQNLSVSTIDIGPGALPPQSPEGTSEDSAADSPKFSQIHLSTPVENNVDHSSNGGSWNGIAKPGIVRLGRPQSLDLKLEPLTPSSARMGSPRQGSSTSPGSISNSARFTDVSDASPTPKSTISVRSDFEPGTSTSLPNITSIPTAPPTLLTEKSFSHRPHRSIGPSTFEKVRSKTRPTFLPPKSRKEDDKHMSDWQEMMKQSRLVTEKRRKALQDRRLARERAIENTLPIWEKEISPNWRIVHKNPDLKRLWWRGIPTKLRASLWEQVVGNELALSKDHYRICLSRARRALSSGVFPRATLEQIEADMETTLPAIQIFHKETGPLHNDLKDMLHAWVVSRSDEGLGYTIGAAKVAAMLLINMPAQRGFIVMRNLLERHLLRSFFGGERTKDEVEAYYRIFDTMLADGMPKIYFNFKQHQVSTASYLRDWIISLFLDHLPFEACARIWDVILLEGDSFLYRASLGILAVLEPRLFFPDRRELLELLKGENKAAIEAAKREGRPLNGGRYEIYGVDEETLWERIDGMDEWWRDSTWTRLLRRELPDL